MNALVRRLSQCLSLVAPAHLRDALLGDLLEECESRRSRGVPAAQTDAWVLRQCACSVVPLLLQRVRRAGGARVALVCAGALAAGVGTHAAQQSGWRWLLSLVPLRAEHAPSSVWEALFVVTQVGVAFAAALLIAWFSRSSHSSLPGGRS